MWPKVCHIANRCFEPHDKKIFLKFTDLQKISTEDDDTNLQVNPKYKNGQTL